MGVTGQHCGMPGAASHRVDTTGYSRHRQWVIRRSDVGHNRTLKSTSLRVRLLRIADTQRIVTSEQSRPSGRRRPVSEDPQLSSIHAFFGQDR